MIARNIAPGLRRHFAFENWDWYPKVHLETLKDEAKAKIYPSGDYKIIGCDIDPAVREKAEYNARVAGVASDITWHTADILENEDLLGVFPDVKTLISNPPYGERLQNESIDEIHRIIATTFRKHSDLSGGVITNYEPFIFGTKSFLERRRLWNGSIECQYCYRKKQIVKK
jgi:putative N6-adenine-specific DNA methylase